MEEGDREMIGGGVITHQNGEYKMIGRTSNNKEYPELDFEFMQSIAGQVCDVL